MVDYIFNEKQYVEKMMQNCDVDINAPMKTVRLLARYCNFVDNQDEDVIYKRVVSYMEASKAEFHEHKSMNKIKKCIRSIKSSGPWRDIKQVNITASELNRIKELNDEKQEKIAFVLLADVKYHAACNGTAYNTSFLSISDIFKLARVPCPYKERPYFMHFLFKDRDGGSFAEKDLRQYSKNNAVQYRLNYVSYGENDPVELQLYENNYKELAFTYLNWKNGGYKTCTNCGRLFKASKKSQSDLCKQCYEPYRRKKKTEVMQKLREKH